MLAVTAKASPEEALREVRQKPEGSFDLVITVARTEGTGIDGFGLLEHLRNRLPVIRKSFAINLEASSLESLIALPTY
jgi:CheY-like chemotaxis protein